MKWQDFYRFPLKLENHTGIVITDIKQENNNRYSWAFEWIDNSFISEHPINGGHGEMLADHIVNYLNNKTEYRPLFNWSINDEDATIININNEPCIKISGFGELLNVHKCLYDEAVEIQNNFRNYIINKLNGILNF